LPGGDGCPGKRTDGAGPQTSRFFWSFETRDWEQYPPLAKN